MDSDYEALKRIMNDPDMFHREKLRAIEEQARKSGDIQDGICSSCRQPLIRVVSKGRIYHPERTYKETCAVANDNAEVGSHHFFDIEFLDLPKPDTSW